MGCVLHLSRVTIFTARFLTSPSKTMSTVTLVPCELSCLGHILDTANDRWNPHVGPIHARLLKLHTSFLYYCSLWNKQLKLYMRLGLSQAALRVFDRMPQRDVVSYNTIISAYSSGKQGFTDMARLYMRMLDEEIRPDHITFCALISALSNAPLPFFLEQIHAQLMKFGLNCDKFVGSALVNAYEGYRGIEASIGAFNEIKRLDSVCWNVMIDVCDRRGDKRNAKEVLRRMLKERIGFYFDCFTLASALKTCTEKEDFGLGTQLHTWACKAGLECETPIGNALVTMYMRCGGSMEMAVRAFRGIMEPNIISWTAMISGLVQNELPQEAIAFYREMICVGERENDFCFSSLLPALGSVANLEFGKMVHCRIIRSSFSSDLAVCNALIDMYFKCGRSKDAEIAFQTMKNHDVVSYTVTILGCGQNGNAKKALELFKQMEDKGFKPDSITFLATLSACSHGGFIDQGLGIFKSMVYEHQLEPKKEHFACVVDLFGRGGRFSEAEGFIRNMGLEMDPLAWESLLGACGIHGEVKLGQKSAEKVLELDPKKDGAYVVLSNVYAGQRRWRQKEEVRERVDSFRVRKETACSWFRTRKA